MQIGCGRPGDGSGGHCTTNPKTSKLTQVVPQVEKTCHPEQSEGSPRALSLFRLKALGILHSLRSFRMTYFFSAETVATCVNIQNLPPSEKEIALPNLTPALHADPPLISQLARKDLRLTYKSWVQQSNSIQTGCLCYNAANMQHQLRFANNNNNDNDDLRIVGRSVAE